MYRSEVRTEAFILNCFLETNVFHFVTQETVSKKYINTTDMYDLFLFIS